MQTESQEKRTVLEIRNKIKESALQQTVTKTLLLIELVCYSGHRKQLLRCEIAPFPELQIQAKFNTFGQ